MKKYNEEQLYEVVSNLATCLAALITPTLRFIIGALLKVKLYQSDAPSLPLHREASTLPPLLLLLFLLLQMFSAQISV